MTTATLGQLQRRYSLPYLTLTELRVEHFPHIQTDRHLRRLIESGAVNITLQRLHESKRSPLVVPLEELARYLDERLQHRTAA